MRGKQPYSNLLLAQVLGSPPHARGAGCVDILADTQGGITPACAGSRVRQRSLVWLWRDHPRMRGEQRTLDALVSGDRGSPPHARGAVERLASLALGCGITPACAGSSLAAYFLARASRDHPRMRGEQK